MTRLKRGSRVLVIAGNDRGQSGEVIALKGEKVLVKGVNVRKKHMKQRSEHTKSQILEMEKPIHQSNVVLCLEDGTRIKRTPALPEESKTKKKKK
ncbi:MAG: 50S ribosomal protein L24 [Simkaniaceae bacterium]|nr:50S ribosomal protein L24 [Simkaniaceae bacterium]